jgi:hypothetical protein
MTLSDFNLNAMITDMAVEIFEETSDRDEATDRAHEYADGSEYVIYHHKSHELCQNCNTDYGTDFFQDCGPFDDLDYNKCATIIAYGEINGRLNEALHGLYDMQEAA